jgi:hypothetical protein
LVIGVKLFRGGFYCPLIFHYVFRKLRQQQQSGARGRASSAIAAVDETAMVKEAFGSIEPVDCSNWRRSFNAWRGKEGALNATVPNTEAVLKNSEVNEIVIPPNVVRVLYSYSSVSDP